MHVDHSCEKYSSSHSPATSNAKHRRVSDILLSAEPSPLHGCRSGGGGAGSEEDDPDSELDSAPLVADDCEHEEEEDFAGALAAGGTSRRVPAPAAASVAAPSGGPMDDEPGFDYDVFVAEEHGDGDCGDGSELRDAPMSASAGAASPPSSGPEVDATHQRQQQQQVLLPQLLRLDDLSVAALWEEAEGALADGDDSEALWDDGGGSECVRHGGRGVAQRSLPPAPPPPPARHGNLQ